VILLESYQFLFRPQRSSRPLYMKVCPHLCMPQLWLAKYLSVQTTFWTDIAQKNITQMVCPKIYFAQALWFWDHSKEMGRYYTLFVLCLYIQIYLAWIYSINSIHCTVFCFSLTNINKCIHLFPMFQNLRNYIGF